MIQEYRHRNLLWIDVVAPTKEEALSLMDRFGLDPLIVEELLSPTLKPKVDLYKEYIYLILHFPAVRHSHKEARENQEIDFIVGKDFIITGRYDTIDPLHKFSKEFEVNSILDRSQFGDHAGFIFFYMIRKLYKSVIHELDFLGDKLQEIEGRIFSGKEKEMVFELSKASRSLLIFKQAMRLHREVLESFDSAAKKFFGEDFQYHLKSISGSYWRVMSLIESKIDTLQELRATNNSLLSTKENEIMKTLAIVSFITFPLTLVATIFGMNAKDLPIIGQPGDFWIIMKVMLIFTGLVFSFFHHKNWI